MSSLTPQQLQAVSMVAVGKPHIEIAAELGISTKTIQRWLKKSEFTQAVKAVQLETVERVVEFAAVDVAAQIKNLIPKAISTLQEYLDNPDAKGSDRLRAAQILGNWAGLNQVPTAKPSEQPAEQNLKNYLDFLSSKNGNCDSANKN